MKFNNNKMVLFSIINCYLMIFLLFKQWMKDKMFNGIEWTLGIRIRGSDEEKPGIKFTCSRIILNNFLDQRI